MSSKAPKQDGDDEAARARALALLEATHQFPCHYEVTVIAFNQDTVTDAVRRAAGAQGLAAGDPPEQGARAEGSADLRGAITHQPRSSREGKYLSHRFAVHVMHAGEVLELYARLRVLEGVVTLL